jgi:hypothetical protein
VEILTRIQRCVTWPIEIDDLPIENEKKTQFNTSLLVFRRVSDGEEPDGTCITTA